MHSILVPLGQVEGCENWTYGYDGHRRARRTGRFQCYPASENPVSHDLREGARSQVGLFLVLPQLEAQSPSRAVVSREYVVGSDRADNGGNWTGEAVSQESDQLFARGIRPRIEQEAEQIAADIARQRLEVLASKEDSNRDAESEREEREHIRAELSFQGEEIRHETYRREMEYRAEHPVEEFEAP